MNIPELIDIVFEQIIYKWRDNLEAADACGFGKKQKHEKEVLLALLDDDNKKFVNHLELAVENKLDYIYYEVCKLLLYFGIKTGMDMQKALEEE